MEAACSAWVGLGAAVLAVEILEGCEDRGIVGAEVSVVRGPAGDGIGIAPTGHMRIERWRPSEGILGRWVRSLGGKTSVWYGCGMNGLQMCIEIAWTAKEALLAFDVLESVMYALDVSVLLV